MDLFPGTRGVTLNNPFVCCNRHRFNRVPGAHLGIAYVSAASLRWAEGEGKGWAEGEYRFSSLMKQKIKCKNCAVFCFAGKRFFFIFMK